ncbi:MAG TPA: R3H domain-containing nucleic acid-binding protein [Candidatus Paceibacterota bacterium]|nr:R3H domain-containing nucleic acid-binding protein [Candidatus Paceibacterota bacterium]
MEETKKIIEKLFQSMGLDVLEIIIKKDDTIKDKKMIDISISIDSRDAGRFIKENGEGLDAVQHITRLLVLKHGLGQSFLVLDINGYKEGRKNELIDLALKTAKEVRRNRKTIILEPMPAYERRIIHLKLAEQPDIATESIGQEQERRVMIRVYP